MGNRIAILNAGILQQVGTPLDVYERPQNLFVANFIGTPPMNFLKCVVEVAGESVTLAARSFKLQAPGSAVSALKGRAGQTIVVGVRPEHVLEEGRPTRGVTSPVELVADMVETLGDEVVVHGSTGDDQISFKMDPHQPPGFGDKVKANVEIDRLHLFDEKTELRIT